MNIEWKKVIIRPELAAPEVDDYDEVTLSDITNSRDIGIGSYVEYTLPATTSRDTWIEKYQFSH
jgi:hypothetical protein